jgi:hypothetical protein
MASPRGSPAGSCPSFANHQARNGAQQEACAKQQGRRFEGISSDERNGRVAHVLKVVPATRHRAFRGVQAIRDGVLGNRLEKAGFACDVRDLANRVSHTVATALGFRLNNAGGVGCHISPLVTDVSGTSQSNRHTEPLADADSNLALVSRERVMCVARDDARGCKNVAPS